MPAGQPPGQCGRVVKCLLAAQMICWGDLPHHVLAIILRTAFQDSGRALSHWLQLAMVCRHARAPLLLASWPSLPSHLQVSLDKALEQA